MKKTIYGLVTLAFVLCSTGLLAETGVLVHLKDGKTVFFPDEETDHVEFLENYTPSEDEIYPPKPQQPENPGDENTDPSNPEQPENPGDENTDPSNPEQPENPGDENTDPSNPEQPENPGDENNDPSNPEQPENPGDENTDPSNPEQPENPGDENTDPSDPDQPENPGDENNDPSNPEQPENPGDENNDPSNPEQPENPGDENTDPSNPEQPENPGDENTDPSNPEQPENPGDENTDPTDPEKPETSLFKLYTGQGLPLNQTYLIVAGKVCAGPVEVSKSYGYLPANNVTITDNTISDNLSNGFIFTSTCSVNGTNFTAPNGKFLIKDSNNRYLLLKEKYTSFNLSDEVELNGSTIKDNYLFYAQKNDDGSWMILNTKDGDTKFIAFSSQYNNFAAYNTLSKNDSFPFLYILGEDYSDPGQSENPGDENTDPSEPEEPENPGENGGFVLPDAYKYPLSYVILPENTPQQVKDYTGFTVNFNKDNHTPNYVAWELTASETNGSVATSRNYWVDKDIDGCLSTDFGYSTYGYERGHMCPAAEQKWSSAAMKDAAVMTNMLPQKSSLNGKIWGTLENMEREWAKRDGAIWIVAGPVYYDFDDLYIGQAKARVPSACFKAFLYNDANNPRAIAFVFSNGENTGNIENFAMSIDDLEEILGYDLFPALPDDIEEKVEATFSFSDWK